MGRVTRHLTIAVNNDEVLIELDRARSRIELLEGLVAACAASLSPRIFYNSGQKRMYAAAASRGRGPALLFDRQELSSRFQPYPGHFISQTRAATCGRVPATIDARKTAKMAAGPPAGPRHRRFGPSLVSTLAHARAPLDTPRLITRDAAMSVLANRPGTATPSQHRQAPTPVPQDPSYGIAPPATGSTSTSLLSCR